MTVATSFYQISINDNTKKKDGTPEFSSTEFPLVALTAGNLAAQATLIAALKAAILPIILGDVRQDTTIQNRPIISVSRPTNTEAQREKKWLLRAHGATSGQKGHYSIGTADLSLLPDGSEFLDLTVSPGDALKTAFDAVVHNRNDGAELMVLDSVQYVGTSG